MKHLELSDMEFYVSPGEEWTTAVLLRHEKITEHIMDCQACCQKLDKYERDLVQIRREFEEEACLLGHESEIREQLRRAERMEKSSLNGTDTIVADIRVESQDEKKQDKEGKITF